LRGAEYAARRAARQPRFAGGEAPGGLKGSP